MRRRPAVVVGVFLLALAVRLGYLHHVASAPGFVWADPDSYMAHGLDLARAEGGWRFSFDAVEHAVEGRRYALPPLYPVFLSLFASFPGYPLTAQIGQAILAAAGVVFVFCLGSRLHSERAGILAALIAALWLPNVIAVWSTMQEALYVPLVLLSFVLLFRAHDSGRVLDGMYPGIAFGAATLTRSMPFYYLPIALALLFGRNRRGALTMLGGFALLTVPYSIALSLHLGDATFVENHGGLRVVTRYGEGAGQSPPGVLGTGATLVRAFVSAPGAMAGEWWETARSLLHVNGGRLLQLYLAAETKWGAVGAKIAAHLFGDLTFVTVLILAPFGIVLSRRPELGAYLGLWIVVNLALTTLSGFGGARLRAPVEPHLVVLAAVVLAGGYRGDYIRALLVPAAVFSTACAVIVVPQVPGSLRARADYGVYWPLETPTKRAPMRGEAGLNLLAVDGELVFYLRPRNPSGSTRVDVTIGGSSVDTLVIEGQEHRFRFPWPTLELVHVELSARDSVTNEPVRVLIVVPRR